MTAPRACRNTAGNTETRGAPLRMTTKGKGAGPSTALRTCGYEKQNQKLIPHRRPKSGRVRDDKETQSAHLKVPAT